MRKSATLHSVCSFLKHFFRAWNTSGEGIHSPYLFHLVRFVLRDRNPFYCFAEIERKRAQMPCCDERTDVGQMMFRLVHFMGEYEQRPLRIVEVGASSGIITAYLSTPSSRNEVTCLYEDTLYKRAREEIDVVYLHDGYTAEEERRIADFLLPRMTEKGVLAVENIHESKAAEQVWAGLKADKRVTSSMDLYHVGLLFVDKHYLRRHYTIRL